MSTPAAPTLADVLAELRSLRAEVRELRQQTTNTTTRSAVGLVSAAVVADELGISRQWVYQHSDDLGAVRIGSGPKARLRFDVDIARQALGAAARETTTTTTPVRHKTSKRSTTAGSILKVRTT